MKTAALNELIELLLESMQGFITRQHVGHAGIGLTPLPNRGEELPVLKFDTIHGHVDVAHINGFFTPVHKIIIAGDIGSGITDVAKEGS